MNGMIEGQASQLYDLLHDENDISLMLYLEKKQFSHNQQRAIIKQLKAMNSPTQSQLAGLLDQNLI
ncbi:hypothetical protein K6Y31_00970 [Motilimonas cestriensis]|uniref:MarR family transcriptional regulator n=1 Tax=Motilimonas cestriensis TaxID=2742685 RepID=A0ABS8W6M0_9GAMM|nr:hypothetical protein [Motilimonas cestriensis]MCE2593391.1 hypothetical protein [Motilimonas cestriensis]